MSGLLRTLPPRTGAPGGTRGVLRLLLMALATQAGWARADASVFGTDPRDVDLAPIFARSAERGVVDAVGLERELRGIDPIPVAALFTALDRGGLDDATPLDPVQLDVARRVLLDARAREVRRHLELVVRSKPRIETRELGVWILGEIGDAAALGLILELASVGAEGGGSRSLHLLSTRALRTIVDRDPRALRRLSMHFGEVSSTRGAIAESLESCDDPDALGTMAELLDVHPDAAAILLPSIGRRALGDVPPFDDSIRASVRPYLRETATGLVLAAMSAAGKLEDYDAIGDLVLRLDDGDPGLRRGAHRALIEISRQSFPAQQAAWKRWHGREQAWWASSAPRSMHELRARDPAKVVRAINNLSMHTLRRHELARALTGCLDRDEQHVVILACRALERLSSRSSVEELIAQLEAPDEATRAAAHRALVAIAGEDPGADRMVWWEEWR